MDFRALGPVEVESEGRHLTPGRPRERAVLAILLVRYPAPVGVEELIDSIWGERPPPTARTALQGLVSSLRRSLGPGRIETAAGGYRLRLLPGDRLDIDRFDALVADAASAPPLARAELLREAVGLFRGEPFGDVNLAVSLHAEGARLEGRRLAAEEALIAAELDLGRHAAVLPRLEHLVGEHPVREGLRAQLMLALYREGRQADALRVAQDARTVLASELGIEPGPALQRLEQQILEQEPSLLARADPPAHMDAPQGDGLATFLALRAASAAAASAAAASGAPDLVEDLAAFARPRGGQEVSARRGRVLAFPRARDAAAAAAAIQRAAQRSAGTVRIGLHSGTASADREAEHATMVADVAHPGQIVVSRATRDLLRETPPQELEVRDLGEHRLPDLAPAAPLFQLVAPGLSVDFPPTWGLDTLLTNLPVQATALIDRTAELAEIPSLLRDPHTRLVTLTGPGGTGKTRLALHVAAELLDQAPDGVWFVQLDALSDPALVSSTIAATLRISTDGPSAVTAVTRELDGRRTLLVLDNFEHLLPAAGVVAELLAGAEGLTILVTSRVPLKLSAERVVEVTPLPVPAEPDERRPIARAPEAATESHALLAIPSVALFAERAATARPGFVLAPDQLPAVAALTRSLDGLPLAIELAASRVGVMSPAAILERLDQPLRMVGSRAPAGSARHRALDATIEWSHDLLEPDAQRLFAGLATFAGGWTLDAAEAVCADGDAGGVVEGLAGLVDHSLVRIGGTDADPRFGMLETIREFAAGKLDASGRRAEAEARHVAFFLALAESAEPHLRGNPGEWVARLEVEHANLRAALDRLSGRAPGGRSHTAGAKADAAITEARLAGALWRFWYLAGHIEEGRARLEHALARHPEPSAVRLKALIGAAVMAMNARDPARADERAGEALALAESLGDPWSAAYALFMRSNATSAMGDDDAARRGYEDSLRAFRDLGDEHSALLVTRNLAATLEDLGEGNAARELYQDILRRARATSNGRLEASTLGALAMIAFDEGRVVDATLLLRESLHLHRELGDRMDTALDVARAARALALGDRPAESAQLLGAISAIQDELGPRGRTVAELAEHTRRTLLRRLPAAEVDRLLAVGASFRLDAALELALAALG